MARPVARAIAEQAAAGSARLLLVRRPAGQPVSPGRWVFAVDSRPGHERIRSRHVEDDAELITLVAPFAAADAPGWDVVTAPLLLVCTHGRHDRCCAVRGRPVAQRLADAYRDTVWESTHVGGDRFAANLVVLPAGHYLGRVDASHVVDMVADLADGLLPAGHVRGRSSLPSPVQAAQQFAREAGGRWGVTDLAPTLQEPAGPDRWRIVLGDVEVVVRWDRDGDGQARVLSCGDPAKTSPAFRLVSLIPCTAAGGAAPA